MNIINWNIEWRRGSNRHGAAMRARITSLDPDIVCITEGHTDFLENDFHPIFSDEDYGYPIRQGRRKVALWSKKPWREINAVGSADMPRGRFISGVTDSVVGPLHCVGVCIPWSHAHVTGGRKDAKAWEEHLGYLEGLARYLRGIEKQRLIVMGDFNQMVPRTRAPKKAYEKLMDALPPQLSIETTGPIPDVDKQTLDHITISSDLSVSGLTGLSNYSPTGERLSDHFGISLSIGATT